MVNHGKPIQKRLSFMAIDEATLELTRLGLPSLPLPS